MSGGSTAVVVSCACFGCMFVGYMLSYSERLNESARKGVSTLYVTLCLPAMVFRGVASIDLQSLDLMMMLLILLGKLVVVGACLIFGMVCHSSHGGSTRAFAHAALYAMAATHSFDVTLGVPLAGELFPSYVPYIFMNQSLQLVLINPLLLAAIELGSLRDGGGDGGTLRRVVLGVVTNPIVVMTFWGIMMARFAPGGMPPIVRALINQIADAGTTPCSLIAHPSVL